MPPPRWTTGPSESVRVSIGVAHRNRVCYTYKDSHWHYLEVQHVQLYQMSRIWRLIENTVTSSTICVLHAQNCLNITCNYTGIYPALLATLVMPQKITVMIKVLVVVQKLMVGSDLISCSHLLIKNSPESSPEYRTRPNYIVLLVFGYCYKLIYWSDAWQHLKIRHFGLKH